MLVRAPRLVAGLALALTSAAIALPALTRPASADAPEDAPLQHVVFIVQDLGGGAYWVPATRIRYVVEAGSEILFDGDHTVGDLIATLQANGRDLLLLANGATLQPVKEALG